MPSVGGAGFPLLELELVELEVDPDELEPDELELPPVELEEPDELEVELVLLELLELVVLALELAWEPPAPVVPLLLLPQPLTAANAREREMLASARCVVVLIVTSPCWCWPRRSRPDHPT